MDNEKIKELAREYWDSKSPANMLKDYPEAKVIADMMKNALSGHIEELVKDYTEFLMWLTKTHCIVEKSQARELAKLTLDNDQSVDYGLIDGLTDWVLENFSEEYREEAEK